MRYLLVLSYDGAAFKGWQIQPDAPSVQQAVERALQLTLRTEVAVVGAGRTDAEVNARMMVAHFDVAETVGTELLDEGAKERLLYRLNAILRPSVAIYDCVRVADDFHARFDAVSRTYRYYLHTVADPFVVERSRYFHLPVDFEPMNREALDLLGTQDFTSFSKLHTDTKNNICTITSAAWHQYCAGHYYFEITANRFLRNMVRAIVGTLLDVGTGKAGEGHVRRVIEAKNRCDAGMSVPGHALYLWDIAYRQELPCCPLPQLF